MVGESAHESVTTVATSDVTVTRSLEQKEGGIVGILTIESDHDRSLLVSVDDHFPDDFPAEEARFKPGTEPDMGDIGASGIELEQQVGDNPVEIGFGIILEEPVENVGWGSPHITGVRPIERAVRSNSSETDRLADSSSRTEPTDGDPPSGEGVIYRAPRAGRASTDSTPDSAAEAEATETNDDSSADPSDQSTTAPANEMEFDQRLSEGELAAMALSNAIEAPSETQDTDESRPTADRSETDADSTSASETQSTTPSESQSTSSSETQPDATTGQSTAEMPSTAPADDSASERSDTAAPASDSEDRHGESPAIDHTEAQSATVPRSLELRLDRLSARMEEFATYATALEAIIDEYGTGSELIADLDGRLDAVESQLTTVNEELATIREERDQSLESIRGTLETTQSSVDSVESDVQSLSARLDDEVEQVDDRLDALEGTVQTLSEDVESMGETLETIEDDIESLHQFRRSLAEISQNDQL